MREALESRIGETYSAPMWLSTAHAPARTDPGLYRRFNFNRRQDRGRGDYTKTHLEPAIEGLAYTPPAQSVIT